MATQQCARIGCAKSVTYYKPLCYEHWKEFDRHFLQECEKCHRFYDSLDLASLWDEGADKLVGEWELCLDCNEGKDLPVHAHAPIDHQVRYLDILKLDRGEFYVGRTNTFGIKSISAGIAGRPGDTGNEPVIRLT